MNDSDQPTSPESDETPSADTAEAPDTADMKKPSTEKEPAEEPKAPARSDPEPSHEAVGIGIIGRPQVEPEIVEDADA